MKMTFVKTFSVSLCAMMMALMTGCNFNTPQQPVTPLDPEEEEGTPLAVKTTYSYATHDDQLKFFNITIEYYDGDGTKKQEQIKETTWVKSVESKSLPANFGMRILYKLNTNYSISPTKVEWIGYDYSIDSYAVDKNGKLVGERYHKYVEFDEDCASAKLEKWLESYSNHPSSLFIKYDKTGKGTFSTWE